MCTAVLIGWVPATPPPPPPPHLGSNTGALLVSQDRRHLYVTPCKTLSQPRNVFQNGNDFPVSFYSNLFTIRPIHRPKQTIPQSAPWRVAQKDPCPSYHQSMHAGCFKASPFIPPPPMPPFVLMPFDKTWCSHAYLAHWVYGNTMVEGGGVICTTTTYTTNCNQILHGMQPPPPSYFLLNYTNTILNPKRLIVLVFAYSHSYA